MKFVQETMGFGSQKKAKPRSAATHTGFLTTMSSEVTSWLLVSITKLTLNLYSQYDPFLDPTRINDHLFQSVV